jgi:cytoskeletal protein CcmA (bactofilin family)
MSGLNKIVTSISALTDDIIMPNNNDVVCIDTENSRIGVKTSSPAYDIDVSGTVKTNILRLGSDVSMTFLESRIFTSNNIRINAEISCNSFITSSIVSTDISSTSNLYVKIIRPITGNDISINGNIRFDGSLNSTTLVVRNINPLVGRDISINGNVVIDGSLNIKGMGYTAYGQITSSDDRLKHNEELITNALITIRQLSPQIYQKTSTFKDPHYRGPLNDPYIIEAGLIAQEVEKIDELKFSVISGNEQSPYSLNYNNIFVYGLAALKELDSQVQTINENLNKNENFIKNEGTNDLATIVNNKIIYIGLLEKKIELLESRLTNIEKAF